VPPSKAGSLMKLHSHAGRLPVTAGKCFPWPLVCQQPFAHLLIYGGAPTTVANRPFIEGQSLKFIVGH